MIGLIKTCSVWKNSNIYRLCQTEYVVLFMWNSFCCSSYILTVRLKTGRYFLKSCFHVSNTKPSTMSADHPSCFIPPSETNRNNFCDTSYSLICKLFFQIMSNVLMPFLPCRRGISVFPFYCVLKLPYMYHITLYVLIFLQFLLLNFNTHLK
jgi:hypothetical protein